MRHDGLEGQGPPERVLLQQVVPHQMTLTPTVEVGEEAPTRTVVNPTGDLMAAQTHEEPGGTTGNLEVEEVDPPSVVEEVVPMLDIRLFLKGHTLKYHA